MPCKKHRIIRFVLTLWIAFFNPTNWSAENPNPALSPTPDESSTFTLGTIFIEAPKAGSLDSRDILTSVDVLTSSSLLEQQNVSHSWELFRNMPGIQITRFNQGTTSGKLSFRAFNGEGEVNAVKLLIDGVPSNSNDGNMPFLDVIFPLEIESIEVVRGTNDPRYGLHNIAGNAHIHTKMGGTYLRNRFTFGSFGTFDMQHIAGYELDGFTQNYFAAFRNIEGYRDHSQIDQYTLSGKWFYSPDSREWRIGLILRWYESDAQEPGYLTLTQSREDPTQTRAHNASDGSNRQIGQVSAHLDAQLRNDLSFSLKSYGNLFRDRRWVTFSAEVPQQERIADEVQYGTLTALTWRPEVFWLDDFALEVGADFHYQENDSIRYLTERRHRTRQTRDQRFTFFTYGGYIQGIIKPFKWLKIVPGYRADGIGGDFINQLTSTRAPIYNYGTISQPKISVVLTPLEGYNFYGNWGRTFQVGLASGAYKLDPRFGNLAPSINEGWEVGIKFKPVNWLEGRVAYWEQVASGEVRRKLNDPLGDSENVGATKRRGFDAQVGVQPIDRLYVWGAYSLQEAKVTRSNDPTTVGKWIDHVPDFIFSGGVDYQFTPQIRGSFWANLQGDYYPDKANNRPKFGDYALLHLTLAYQVLDWVGFEFQVRNLTDQYYEYVWDDGQQTLHSPGDGRAFYGVLNLKFN